MNEDRALTREESVTMILAVLRENPLHGYGIAQAVQERSSNRLNFHDGTLYTVLRELEDDELISSEWAKLPGERRKRMYSLNPKGLAELEKRVARWREFTGAFGNLIEGAKAFLHGGLSLS